MREADANLARGLSWNNVWKSIRTGSIVDALGEWMLRISAGALFLLMIVMAAYIVSRKLGIPIPAAQPFSEQIMMFFLAFPLAAVAYHNEHTKFEIFLSRASPRNLNRLDCLAHALGMVLFGILAWYTWILGFNSLAKREVLSGIVPFPVYPFRIVLAVGLTVFSLQLLVLFLRGIAKDRNDFKSETT